MSAIPTRAVHLDLKGLPPTPERLLQLVDVFDAAGYNAILVEWEDMFPWTVDPRFQSPTVYSRETVRAFARRAAELSIELIPLVQCLGHMETVLKHDDYAHLREQPDRFDCLNPLAPGARELIEAMVDDVLQLMPEVRWFHLGGDEAWAFGSHPDTRAFAESHGKDRLYLQHVEPILDGLMARNARPLLWHDMMIHWSDEALRALAKKADLVVWGYVGHPDEEEHHFNTRYTERFAELDVPLWGAGAYKGADGMSKDLPDVDARMLNARAWVELAGRFEMQGLIATAWSRYSTHRIQNEPIEGSLDTLVRIGRLWRAGEETDAQSVLKEMGWWSTFHSAHAALSQLARTRDAAWDRVRTAYENLALPYADPGQLVMERDWITSDIQKVEHAAQAVRTALAEATDPQWLEEYLAARIDSLRHALEGLRAESAAMC